MSRVNSWFAAAIGRFSLKNVFAVATAGCLGLTAFQAPESNRENAWIEAATGVFLVLWFWQRCYSAVRRDCIFIAIAALQSIGMFWLLNAVDLRQFLSAESDQSKLDLRALGDFAIWAPVILTAATGPRPDRTTRLRQVISAAGYGIAACWILWIIASNIEVAALVQMAIWGIFAAIRGKLGDVTTFRYVPREDIENQLVMTSGAAVLLSFALLGYVWTLAPRLARGPRWIAGSIAAATILAVACWLPLYVESVRLTKESAPLVCESLSIAPRHLGLGVIVLATTCLFLAWRRIDAEAFVGTISGIGRTGRGLTLFGLSVLAFKEIEYVRSNWSRFSLLYDLSPFYSILGSISCQFQEPRGFVLFAGLIALSVHWFQRKTAVDPNLSAPRLRVLLPASMLSLVLACGLAGLIISGTLFGYSVFVARNSPLDLVIPRGP